MCNLFNQTSAKEAMRHLFPDRPWTDETGNAGPSDIYPDRHAVMIRSNGNGMKLVMARWGLPSPPMYHSKSGIDRGVTNVRNTSSPHWRRWLGPENRCLVPFDRFSEPVQGGGIAWFELKDKRPAILAGINVPGWMNLRKLKDGLTTDDLCVFLTCEPNAEVVAIHPKAMPVILNGQMNGKLGSMRHGTLPSNCSDRSSMEHCPSCEASGVPGIQLTNGS